ncbi:aminopeptidase N [Shewanella pealeana]|uniref:Aminopeptidase N n=1 Tax=Shewanella pealeana (strain ATCC 700345 / ANG-SQ1) TaxID=398579 RepID=A8H0R3_SHEPA|nr:aminopeptidase N [Shewanella pealeana]ABV86150.1 aminopeptidase N [Shewanella pealeana ATCC 700345]
MKLPFIGFTAAVFCSLIAANASGNQVNIERDATPYISQQVAAARAERISEVKYDLDFTLTEQHFSAVSKVSFELSDTTQPLSLDLNQARISSFTLNGKKVYPNYNNSYIQLNPRLLISGSNTIEVQFTRDYSSNGEGLHRFKDPVDNKVYLYSHFKPAAAQQMFAVFDQPDLKASYTLSVTAPKEWTVISAMRETSVSAQGEQRRWIFPESPKLSPYNFSMHAGPYHEWTDNSGKYPLRLFARQSVAKQVDEQDWFNYTQQGLTFFDNYFGIPYPFNKYDQVLVPDFLYGAMENAAAVTFSESRFLSNSKMTTTEKQRLASVIMHEMAHQWFGNLVTMKWWNGLWLNESFASFMGTMATSQIEEFSHAWRSFYAKNKQAAYQQDSLASTHPIEVAVASSQNAFDNIDAITYSKGASTLKQLSYLIGEKTFQQGVHNYLTQYSYQNAELKDFITSLEQAAKRDLSQWSQDWLYKAGVNTLEAEFSCSNGRISSFSLKQTAPSSALPTLREQKVLLGLFTQGRNRLHHNISVPVTYSGEKTEVKQVIGLHCPALVYPNYQDWGFVKVSLDPVSFKAAQANLASVDDPLLRSMLWQSLWDSVENGSLTLNDYIGTVLINLPGERDLTILDQVLTSLSSTRVYLDKMDPSNQRYAKQAIRAIEQMSLRKVMVNKANRDIQRRWFAIYIEFGRSRDALEHMDALLKQTSSIKGIEIDQDLRWKMSIHLNRYDHRNGRYWLNKERAADKSDSGQKSALAAEVILPEAAKKRQWLNRIQQPTNLPFAKLRTVMENLYPSEQKLLSAATAEQRLDTLAQMGKTHDPVFMRSYNKTLIPTECSYANASRLQRLIDSSAAPQSATALLATTLSEPSLRALKEAVQHEQKCLLIKSKMKH